MSHPSRASRFALWLMTATSLLGVAACDSLNPFKSQRPDQARVDTDARRAPPLNPSVMPSKPGAAMMAPTPAMAAQPKAPTVESSPFDYYDEKGDVSAAGKSGEKDTSTAAWFKNDKPAAQPLQPSAAAMKPLTVRKSFSDNPYYSKDTVPVTAAPTLVPQAPLVVEQVQTPAPVTQIAPAPSTSFWSRAFPNKFEPATPPTVRRGVSGDLNDVPETAPRVSLPAEESMSEPVAAPAPAAMVAPTPAPVIVPTPAPQPAAAAEPVMPVVPAETANAYTEQKNTAAPAASGGWFSHSFLGHVFSPTPHDEELVSKGTTTPPLTSVPPVSDDFTPTKAATPAKMDELRQDHAVADVERAAINQEPSQIPAVALVPSSVPNAAPVPVDVPSHSLPGATLSSGPTPPVSSPEDTRTAVSAPPATSSSPQLLGHVTTPGLSVPATASLPPPQESTEQ